MLGFIKKLFGGKDLEVENFPSVERKQTTHQGNTQKYKEKNESTHQANILTYKENNDVLDGSKFMANLTVKTPFKFLNMHNLIVPLNESEKLIDCGLYGVWLPTVKEKFKLDMPVEMATPYGPVPSDGGDLLPLLKDIRSIVEQSFDKSSALLIARDRVSLVMDTFRNKNLPLIFESEDDCFLFLVEEYIGKIKYLNSFNYNELIAKECYSIDGIKNLSDQELLSLKGIGRAKLDNLKKSILDL